MNQPLDPSDEIQEAISRWRREAADLGGRNPLLWYRDLYRGTFDLTVAHPSGVAKLLAGAPTLLSDLVRERVAFGEARLKLRGIRDKAEELRSEHGLTSAFITIGIASWTIKRAPIPPRAPVLLRPCSIAAVDGGYSDFTITADPFLLFNPVLAHYLSSELGLKVDTDALTALAGRNGGFDPRPAYDELEAACAGLEGFGIGPQMVVSTFPWAKLPFVAAIAEGEKRFAASSIIRLLADPAPAQPPAWEGDLDDLRPGETVLAADADQRAVIAAARSGQSFVVDGAPGTGRTQTIANLVADRLGSGARVLVVSERRDALTDLHARLDRVGLGERAWHLGDHPRELPELASALRSNVYDSSTGSAAESSDESSDDATTGAPTAEQITAAERSLRRAEGIIEDHHEAVHGPHDPWGATLAQAQDTLARLAARSRPPVSHVRLTGAALRRLLPEELDDLAADLAQAARDGAWQRGRGDDPWYGARLADEGESARAGDIVSRLIAGELDHARGLARTVCTSAGLPEPLNLEQWRRYLDLLGDAHDTLDIFRSDIYDAPLEELAAAYDPDAVPRPSAVARSRAKRQVKALLRPGMPPADLPTRVLAARDQWASWEELAGRAARPTAVAGWEEAADAFAGIEEDLRWLQGVLTQTPIVEDLRTTHLDTVLERLLRLDARPDRLAHAARSYALLQPLREAGLGPLLDDLAQRGVQDHLVPAEVEFVYWASLLDEFIDRRPPVDGAEVRAALDDWDSAQQVLAVGRAAAIREAIAAPIPQALRRYAPQATYLRDQEPGHDVPGWVGSVAGLAQDLRPVWLVSPVVLPSLVPRRIEFDLVIVDEASHTPVAHTVNALAGADQVIVFGSALDAAPRTFSTMVEDRHTPTEVRESLWRALADRLPTLSLTRDYRTVDARLREPLTRAGASVGHGFPGVLTAPRHSTGWFEADEFADGVAVDVLAHADSGSVPGLSLAVLASDIATAEAVDARVRARIAEAGVGARFRDEVAEPLVITTIDRSATLVRDRVVLALDGSRPLEETSVRTAVLAARRSVATFISGPAGRWPGGPGADILADAEQRAQTPPTESEHPEQLVADLISRLSAEHLSVRGPIGSGDHLIDVVIDDPDRPGHPLVAVRTDIRPWHGTDHLAVIPRHLTDLGWATERVWGTDLFRDPAREVARLVHAVRDASQARAAAQAPAVADADSS